MGIKIAIVEDTAHIAASLEKIIKNSPDFEHILTCTSGEIAIKKLPIFRPQICLLDLGLPGLGGLDCIAPLKESMPDLKIVIFTIFEDENSIVEAIRRGADAYLLKDTTPELLLAELRVVILGGATLTPRVALKISQIYSADSAIHPPESSEQDGLLTARQIEILNHIVLGFTYHEIADELNISPHTVRRHIENIYERLQVNNRSEAIRSGFKFGFLKNLMK